MLYLKTHNYHWNVTGELFHSLHEQFEEQYTELAEAIDEIAERIRSLGYRAPGTFKEFNELTSSMAIPPYEHDFDATPEASPTWDFPNWFREESE